MISLSNRPRVSALSFTQLQRDARVLRQIDALSTRYDVTAIGYGRLSEALAERATMQPLPPRPRSTGRKLHTLATLFAGKALGAAAYRAWYWGKPEHEAALRLLLASEPEVIHANDWDALPVAVRAAEQMGQQASARVVLDLHEYAPLQFENRWHWRTFGLPMVDSFLREGLPRVDAATTVCQMIAERYGDEYGVRPVVILNAPFMDASADFRATDPACIELIYHGAANADRQLHGMIEALALAEPRFRLNFMLVDPGGSSTRSLQRIANECAPDRVRFHPPVAPHEIARRIAEFDVGIFILPFTSFSYQAALPNKFFDFINAGLAVCIGPSPEMARLLRQYGNGFIAPSFEPRDVAALLNSLSAAQIDTAKRRSLVARQELNAEREQEKLLALYEEMA